jgi:hypothetical protein
MTTITLDLPLSLTEQLAQRQIAEEEVKAVALAAIELWLAQPATETEPSGRFSQSAVPFARRLIRQNRELFETLAQR